MNRKLLALVTVAATLLLAAVIPLTTANGRSGHPARAVAAADAATVRTALCHDWKRMDAAHKQAIVKGMHEFFTGPLDIPNAWGTGLTSDQAMKLFNGYCEPAYSDNFRLYRLYGDAATFTPTAK